MQSVIFAVVLTFVALFAAGTVWVMINNGFDVLSLLALIVLALIGFGVIGALLNVPPEE